MIHFSYSFCLMMLHSFWQAAFILLLYVALDKIVYKNTAPLAKRNFLYTALLTQLVLSGFTFSFYFFDAQSIGAFGTVTENISSFIGAANIQLFTPWIFSLYIFIIAYKLIKAVYTWYYFKLQYKTGLQKPAVHLKLFTALKAHQYGIKRKVILWLSSNIQTPITFGFFKPVILLPVALVNNISVQQAETLILHELTHIHTHDYLLNWFLLMTESIFFFNPFVTGLCKKIKMEREKNCDIHVMAFAYSPALYAETLLQAEKMKQLVPNFQLAAVNSKKYLLQRIRFFTNDNVLTQPMRFNIIAPLIGLILLLMLSMAVLLQSGSTSSGISSAAGIPYLPVSNYLFSDADLNKVILSETKPKANNISKTEIEQQVIVNEITKPLPVKKLKQVTAIAEEKINESEEIFAVPVTTKENDAARQIIVKEEGSGSASVKVYYLHFENGKWILQPEWVITSKEIYLDSLSGKIDSLKTRIRRAFPAQQ